MESLNLDGAIWTNVQYNGKMNREPTVRVDRIRQEMARKGLKPGEIAEYSGVKYDTLYKILNHNRPSTSAEIVAKLAAYFNCSVEYLLGMTDERAPIALTFSKELDALLDIAKHLSARRQRDLLAVARAYLEASRELRGNPDLLMSELMDVLREAGGDLDKLIDYLRRPSQPPSPPALGEDDMEDSSNDNS